jgi:DNA-binding transcriptional LysR family regulator
MTLTQLRRFLSLAEVKNFHASAERLHITQPALSQSIQKLEASIGEPLFLRGARGVELTEVGKLLVPRAKLILKFSEDFVHEVDELRNRRQSRIRVGVAPYFARDLFPAAFARFAARRPDVLVDIMEEQTIELVDAIEQGELDMAICGQNAVVAERQAIEFEYLLTEEYSLFARTGHPVFETGADPMAMLAEYPWAVIDREISARGFASLFQERGLPAPPFSVQTHSLQVIMSIVCSSDHVALIADDFARPELASGRIREIHEPGIEIATRGGIFLHREAPRSPAVEAMIESLREVCRERSSAARGAAVGA